MKGCYGIVIHYLRVLALFAAPLMFVAAGMAFQGVVRVGNMELGGLDALLLAGVAVLFWVIVAARVMRKK